MSEVPEGSEPSPRTKIFKTTVLVLAGLSCLGPWSSPGLALILGIFLALTMGNPYPRECARFSKPLLQVSVVALGFGMDLTLLLRAGRDGFFLGAITIGLTFLLGRWLGGLLAINPTTSALISAGTAICGGSAIAAVGSVIAAAGPEMAVAMGTIFLLNGVALYLFPLVGHALSLSSEAFGTWAGIAIHDVSSVVGAASTYSARALEVATAVKLSRALWIVPVSLVFASLWHRGSSDKEAPKAKLQFPWFILGFVLASLARSASPLVLAAAPTMVMLAHAGMNLTLFLIGAGLSRQTLGSVGIRPLAQGIILWITISVGSLFAVMAF